MSHSYSECINELTFEISNNNLNGILPAVGGGRVVRWCWVNFQSRGVLLIWIKVGKGPITLAVGAG